LHVGNILNFSLTAGLGRQTGAGILLRIDDLDRERADAAFLEDIFATLRFLEIPWDEGPGDMADFETSWSQVRRMGLYERALALLREKGKVFACSCSRAELARAGGSGYPGTCRDRNISFDAPDVNWRLKTGSMWISYVNLRAVHSCTCACCWTILRRPWNCHLAPCTRR